MAVIKKKIWPEFFDLVASGSKKFEVRLNDCAIAAGDMLALEEWDPKTEQYTGRKIEKKVGYILRFKLDDFGQRREIEEKGLQIISLE